tara:strand:- start:4046 stop:4753 length:708 start_codon:yes stop_codon:yes gene_type:complete
MKHFLMVGASRGLGRVTRDLFEENGIETTILSRQYGKGLNESDNQIDLADLLQVRTKINKILTKLGTISGVCFFQRLRDPDNKDDDNREINVSLQSTRIIIEEAVKFLDHGQDHSFTLVSSVNSNYVSIPAGFQYHIAKSGLDIAAKYYAVKYGHLGARFNTVNPGTFIKPDQDSQDEHSRDIPTKISSLSPLGRTTRAAEIAELILFLSKPNSSAITGQNITIDTGVSLRWPEN